MSRKKESKHQSHGLTDEQKQEATTIFKEGKLKTREEKGRVRATVEELLEEELDF